MTGARMRLAIVGAGWAGQRHARAIAELNESFEVARLVDTDAQHLQSVAAELKIAIVSTDYGSVLEDPQIDAVAICTPHGAHRAMTLQAVEAGKHVLVEKPMALSLVDAQEMVDAAERAGVSLVVAENQAYDSVTLQMKEAVASGTIAGHVSFGQVVAGYRAVNPSYPGRRAWLTSPEAGGTGTWWLQGVHTVSRARAIFGDIQTVFAVEHRTPTFERSDLEGTVSCLLTIGSGASVSLIQTTEVDLGTSNVQIRVYGDAGRMSLEGDVLSAWQGTDQISAIPVEKGGLSSYARQYRAFARDIEGLEEAPTSGRRELNTLAVVEGALRSIQTGATVDISSSIARAMSVD